MTPVLIILSGTLGLSALALRRAGDLDPDPGNIQTQAGMGHMLTGVFAWISTLITLVAAVALYGAFAGLAVVAGILIMMRLKSLGGRGRPLYRWRLPIALAAVLCSIVVLVALLERLQGAFNV